jgi:hypothetical protein
MKTQTIALGSNPALDIERVGGDLIIEGWERSDLEAQGDNIHIERSGESLVISSDGDLNLSVPRAAMLTVSFVGGDLKVRDLTGPIDISFVGGDAVLRNLTGQVSLNGLVGGDTKLENVIRVSMDANKSAVAHEVSERVKRKVEQVTRRAEQKIRHAEKKVQNAEHKLRHHAQIKANIDNGRWKWNATPGSFPPSGINEPVSDEERMTILKMLQEKKITSEQADKLLSALEGGES